MNEANKDFNLAWDTPLMEFESLSVKVQNSSCEAGTLLHRQETSTLSWYATQQGAISWTAPAYFEVTCSWNLEFCFSVGDLWELRDYELRDLGLEAGKEWTQMVIHNLHSLPISLFWVA